jgi:hypothetical protein
VISTGGTGVTGRDVTPEALHGVYEKEIAGFGEMFRWLSYEKVGTRRSRAGRRPGSPAAPISLRCWARRAPAATPGRAFSCISSTTASVLQLRRVDAASAGAPEALTPIDSK